MDKNIKKTPFYEFHIKAGAKMVPFAGFLMPLQYKKITEEHLNVRRNVGIFDVSHMGEIVFEGKEALKSVQFLITNDINKIKDEKAIYTPVCFANGGIVDDVIVYKFSSEKIFICVNASNTEKDYNHFVQNNKWDCEIQNLSEHYGQIALQGHFSTEIIKIIFNEDIANLKFFSFKVIDFGGVEIILSSTGYTGEKGFEIYIPENICMEIWNKIMEVGEKFSIMPAGLGARDTLRMEMKYCLYGNDIDETTTPLEAGLDWTVKFDKGDFLGRDALLRQKEKGVERILTGFEVLDKGIPRKGYEIFSGDEKIGVVTSGTFSPSLNLPIGLGYLKTGFNEIGSEIFIDIMGLKKAKAKVVKTPFIKRKN